MIAAEAIKHKHTLDRYSSTHGPSLILKMTLNSENPQKNFKIIGISNLNYLNCILFHRSQVEFPFTI